MCLLQCHLYPDTNQQSRHLHRFPHFPTQSIHFAQSLNQAAECVVCRRHLEVFLFFSSNNSSLLQCGPFSALFWRLTGSGMCLWSASWLECSQAAGSVTAGAETQNLSWKRVLGSFSCPKWTELFSEAQFADCRASLRSGHSWSPPRSFFTGY